MLAQASSYMSYIMEGQYKSRLLAFVRGNGVVISGTSKITNVTSNGGQTMHLKRIVYFCIVLQKNVYNCFCLTPCTSLRAISCGLSI